MRRAAGAAAAALAVVAALAGCGGTGEDEYAAEVNTFCTDVRGALQDFQREASAASGGDSEEATRVFGDAVAGLSDDLRQATGRLRELEPPGDYADFNAETVRGFDEAARRLDRVADAAQAGDMGALRDIDRRLGDLDVPDGPPALQERAPACRS